MRTSRKRCVVPRSARGRGARGRPPPRQPPADHRRGRFGQDRGRVQRVADLLADGRPGRGDRRLHVHRAGRRGAEEPDRRAASRNGSARGARPARRTLRRDDPRLLLPAAAAARPSLRDLRRARRQPADRVPLPRGERASSFGSSTRGNRLFASIERFLKSVDVVENELLDPATMPDPFGTVLARLLRRRSSATGCSPTASRSSAPCASSSARSSPRRSTPTLRHLIVDEYQDVNPAQERLDRAARRARGRALRRRRRRSGDLPVARIGRREHRQLRAALPRRRDLRDHDQPAQPARRSSRSRTSSRASIPDRSTRRCSRYRPVGGPEPEVVVWTRRHRARRGRLDRQLILDLHRRRVSRSATSRCSSADERRLPAADRAVRHLRHPGPARRPHRPVRPARSAASSARRSPGSPTPTGASGISQAQADHATPPSSTSTSASSTLDASDAEPAASASCATGRRPSRGRDRTADLVGELYELLDELDVSRTGISTDPLAGQPARHARPVLVAARRLRVGAPPRAARPRRAGRAGRRRGPRHLVLPQPRVCTSSTTRRARTRASTARPTSRSTPSTSRPSTGPRASSGRSSSCPRVTANRFPSTQDRAASRTGSSRASASTRARYEGSDADERRLFYVAITRARDWLSVSRHERVTTQGGRRRARTTSSYRELERRRRRHRAAADRARESAATTSRSRSRYSELAAFLDCGMAFRLRNLLGFQPRLAPELGYGKAVHHVLRSVAETTRATGTVPDRGGDRRDPRRELLPAHREQAGAPAAEGRGPPARRRRTRRSTRPTCTASGRPSGRSSFTSTASRSAVAPT